MRNVKVLGSLFVFLLAGYVYAAGSMPAGVEERKADSGMNVLTNSQGMTLYTYSKDMHDKSMCSGRCAMAWPPLMAPADAKNMGEWTVVTREDGTKQWAFKGMPLYTYAKDTKPGETTGNGMGGNWHIAMP